MSSHVVPDSEQIDELHVHDAELPVLVQVWWAPHAEVTHCVQPPTSSQVCSAPPPEAQSLADTVQFVQALGSPSSVASAASSPASDTDCVVASASDVPPSLLDPLLPAPELLPLPPELPEVASPVLPSLVT
jgi:hypothetical protein